jgi:hypothetical protein
MLRVHWWVPKGINLDERHLYEDWWNGKWKCNFVDLKQWLDISFVFFLVSSLKNVSNKSHITIPSTYPRRVKIILDANNASSNMWRILWTSKELCLWFLITFYIIKLISMLFNQFIHGTKLFVYILRH